jgi:hypothetical protein
MMNEMGGLFQVLFQVLSKKKLQIQKDLRVALRGIIKKALSFQNLNVFY